MKFNLKVQKLILTFACGIFVFLGSIMTIYAGDIMVVNTSDNGEGSLRHAIFSANNLQEPSHITFSIPSTDPHFLKTGQQYQIFIETPLPEINSAYPVKISGKNIILDGSLARSRFSGIIIKTSGHTIEDITIQKFGEHGIWVMGQDEIPTTDVMIRRNKIRENGTFDENGKFGDGIRLTTHVKYSEIYENSVSRNIGSGITLESLTTAVMKNQIFNNLISSNRKNGITLSGSENIFGINKKNRPAPNTIIQNELYGYEIIGRFSRKNQIAYDYIGTSGEKKKLGNKLDGIRLKLGAKNNLIGPSLHIMNNDGGVVITGTDSVGNQIIENNIIGNNSEGILLEKIKGDIEILTKIEKNQIKENLRSGIKLHGASAFISENHIKNNQDFGLELLVHDDGTPNILEEKDEYYSNPTVENNIIRNNSLGGIYALDTIFHGWDTIELDNKISGNNHFDVSVDWYQLFEITPDSDNFAYLQAEITSCNKNGESCIGSEVREAYGKYYLGPDKFFNPKNRDTFFKVSQFKVLGKERTNFSPHTIILTGDTEKKILLNDRTKVEKNLKNLLLTNDINFHTSAPKIIDDVYAGNNFQRLNATLFDLGEISQKKHGINYFWTIFIGFLVLLLLHFYKAGKTLQKKRASF